MMRGIARREASLEVKLWKKPRRCIDFRHQQRAIEGVEGFRIADGSD
jgi:hypothetical protein